MSEREILFRGKRVDNGEWAYGDLLHCDDEAEIYSESVGKNGGYVIPETVGQYTGLTDKSGTRIFEGDIVKYKIIGLNAFGKMEKRETKSIVKYNAPCFSPFETDLYEDYVMPDEVEVIGNIHDNGYPF